MRKILFLSLLLFYAIGVSAQTDQVAVLVGSDTVRFRNYGVWENCAARFRIDVSVSGGDITLTEIDTVGPKMRCMCTYDLEIVMTGLPPGRYDATWFRDYRKKYGYGSDAMVKIGSASFDVAASSGIPVPAQAVQSPCYNPTEVRESAGTVLSLELLAYPNPINAARDNLTLRFSLPDPGPIRIELYDLLGHRMFLQEMDYLPAGVLERKIDGSLLPRTGIYILVVTGDRYRKTLPIFCAATGGKGIRAQGAFSE